MWPRKRSNHAPRVETSLTNPDLLRRPPERLPRFFLSLAVLLTVVVLGWLGWNSYQSHRSSMVQQRSLRILELQGEIVHWDEVLTMSARMAAAIGDPHWEQRYLHFEPLLDGAIQEVMRLDPDAYDERFAAETHAANEKLVEMEHRAFQLVRQGRQDRARELLLSKEYEAQKEIYSQGMDQVAAALQRDAADALRSEQRRGYVSSLMILAAVPTLLVGWLLALITLRRWHTREVAGIQQIGHQAQELLISRLDFVTQVYNRRAFYEIASREIARMQRYQRPLSLAGFDVDNFKQVNDSLGHEVGDELLAAIARGIRDSVRKSDVVARLGGDEFALLMPETSSEAAELVIEKLRSQLLESVSKGGWPATLSIGLVTVTSPTFSIEEILKAADELMYEAKRAGKNKVAKGVVGVNVAASGLKRAAG